MKHPRKGDNPDDPYLREIRRALDIDPERTMASFLGQGVSQETIRQWATNGWITFRTFRGSEQNFKPYIPSERPGTGQGRIIRFADDWKPYREPRSRQFAGIASPLGDVIF